MKTLALTPSEIAFLEAVFLAGWKANSFADVKAKECAIGIEKKLAAISPKKKLEAKK